MTVHDAIVVRELDWLRRLSMLVPPNLGGSNLLAAWTRTSRATSASSGTSRSRPRRARPGGVSCRLPRREQRDSWLGWRNEAVVGVPEFGMRQSLSQTRELCPRFLRCDLSQFSYLSMLDQTFCRRRLGPPGSRLMPGGSRWQERVRRDPGKVLKAAAQVQRSHETDGMPTTAKRRCSFAPTEARCSDRIGHLDTYQDAGSFRSSSHSTARRQLAGKARRRVDRAL